MQDIVYCLIGESGSGKSAVAELLEKEIPGLNVIHSYTTRPKRLEKEWGHIFSVPLDFMRAKQEGKVVAQTFYDKNYYWTEKDQIQGKGASLYVIDPFGFQTLKIKERYLGHRAIGIYLKVDTDIRIARMTGERSSQEISRRVKNDKKSFRNFQCSYVVDNNEEIERAVRRIKGIILKESLGNELFESSRN